MKNMTATGLHFSSDGYDIAGTGFMAGYATYEGTISSDYHDVPNGAILHNLMTFNDLKTHLIKTTVRIG